MLFMNAFVLIHILKIESNVEPLWTICFRSHNEFVMESG